MEMSEEHPKQLCLTTWIWATLENFLLLEKGKMVVGEIYVSLLYFKFIVREDQIARLSLMFLTGGTKRKMKIYQLMVIS